MIIYILQCILIVVLIIAILAMIDNALGGRRTEYKPASKPLAKYRERHRDAVQGLFNGPRHPVPRWQLIVARVWGIRLG